MDADERKSRKEELMSKLTDRASYLKGLADGMDLNMEKRSNKLLAMLLK